MKINLESKRQFPVLHSPTISPNKRAAEENYTFRSDDSCEI